MIELARAGRIDVSGGVSHSFRLDEIDAALALAASRPPGMVRVVVDIN